jgi:hypothetical protein
MINVIHSAVAPKMPALSSCADLFTACGPAEQKTASTHTGITVETCSIEPCRLVLMIILLS